MTLSVESDVCLSVCCMPPKPDLFAGHVRVVSVLLNLKPDSRRQWCTDSILTAEAWVFQLVGWRLAAPAKGGKGTILGLIVLLPECSHL